MSGFAVILDIAFIIFALLIIFSSYKKGFALSALSLAAWIIAITAASYFSKPIAESAYNSFKPKIFGEVGKALNKDIYIDEHLEEKIEILYDSLPEFTLNSVQLLGFNSEEAVSKIERNYPSASSFTVEKLLDLTIKPIILSLLETVFLLIIFIILLPLLLLLAKIISRLFNIPVVSFFNKALGGLFGFVKAIILVMIISLILHLFAVTTNDQNKFINTKNLNSSHIFSYINEKNPLFE